MSIVICIKLRSNRVDRNCGNLPVETSAGDRWTSRRSCHGWTQDIDSRSGGFFRQRRQRPVIQGKDILIYKDTISKLES